MEDMTILLLFVLLSFITLNNFLMIFIMKPLLFIIFQISFLFHKKNVFVHRGKV